MDMVKTLADLTSAFGPSGCEQEISQVIEGLAKPYVDEISRDVMGNLICRRKGSGPRVMFSAHMDSLGLVATHIDEKGFVHVGAVGGVHPAEVLYTPVRFQNGVRGLVCAPEDADMSKLKVTDLLIDLGAADREKAAEKGMENFSRETRAIVASLCRATPKISPPPMPKKEEQIPRNTPTSRAGRRLSQCLPGICSLCFMYQYTARMSSPRATFCTAVTRVLGSPAVRAESIIWPSCPPATEPTARGTAVPKGIFRFASITSRFTIIGIGLPPF